MLFALVAASAFHDLIRLRPSQPPKCRHAPLQLCSLLTCDRYGKDACLHVSLAGVRRVRRITQLPEPQPDAVRVVVVSDTHEQLESVSVPPGDIFCHTGDITFCARGGLSTFVAFNEVQRRRPPQPKTGSPDGPMRCADHAGGCRTRWRLLPCVSGLMAPSRLQVLRALPHEHKLVIAGNHDRHLESIGKSAARDLLSEAIYLENSGEGGKRERAGRERERQERERAARESGSEERQGASRAAAAEKRHGAPLHLSAMALIVNLHPQAPLPQPRPQ